MLASSLENMLQKILLASRGTYHCCCYCCSLTIALGFFFPLSWLASSLDCFEAMKGSLRDLPLHLILQISFCSKIQHCSFHQALFSMACSIVPNGKTSNKSRNLIYILQKGIWADISQTRMPLLEGVWAGSGPKQSGSPPAASQSGFFLPLSLLPLSYPKQ